ncbi:repressor LexA [Candidatus Gracilibacteria bacterium]|jgi:repressor LexA|nr:repressor LexA [Candidatus Gracilibacteria bacterium]
MVKELTDKQKAVLDFIESHQFEFGRSPTLREIREYLEVSSDNSVLKHINALVKKGLIQKDDTPRGIKLLNSVKQRLMAETISVPLLGYVPAGGPAMLEERVEDTISFDVSGLANPSKCFCLRVEGDSMINVGIFDGDLVLVDTGLKPRNGDIVVALVDQGNTVKTYIEDKVSKKVYLQAENPEYPDIYPMESLEIQGVVIKLIRDYF